MGFTLTTQDRGTNEKPPSSLRPNNRETLQKSTKRLEKLNQTVWKHKEFRNQLSTSILVDGFLYGISGDVDEGAHLACMEWETGRVKWVAKGWNAGALLVAGDRLVLLSDTGELIIAEVNPQAFKLQARSKVLEGRCWVSPVMIDGFLLCRNASGRLVCLNLRR